MNFRFFGDSWFWTWISEQRVDYKSESLENLGEYQSGLSLQKILLESMGHNVESFCQPGYSFNQTCRRLANFNEFYASLRNPEVWVIWVSSDLRDANVEHKHWKPDWDLSSKENFLDQYNKYMLRSLQLVNDNVLDNITYLFVGGQQHLPKEDVWDKVTNLNPRMHLLSESILVTLSNIIGDFKWNLGRFYLEKDFVKLVEGIPEKDLDYDLVNMMANHSDLNYEDKESLTLVHKLMWPDMGHMGFNGQVLFVDYLLKFCEDRNLL